MSSENKSVILRVADWMDRWLVSAMIIAASGWAAWVLFSPPSNFAAFPVAFWFVNRMLPGEQEWALLIGAGAALHLLGLAFHACGMLATSRALAFAGMFIQTGFWLIFGGSATISNPDTLFGFNGLEIGLVSAWRLLRISLVFPDGR